MIGWILQLWVAVVFLFAGGAKLAGAAQAVQMYDVIAWGQWFRYVTGASEQLRLILQTPTELLITRRVGSKLQEFPDDSAV